MPFAGLRIPNHLDPPLRVDDRKVGQRAVILQVLRSRRMHRENFAPLAILQHTVNEIGMRRTGRIRIGRRVHAEAGAPDGVNPIFAVREHHAVPRLYVRHLLRQVLRVRPCHPFITTGTVIDGQGIGRPVLLHIGHMELPIGGDADRRAVDFHVVLRQFDSVDGFPVLPHHRVLDDERRLTQRAVRDRAGGLDGRLRKDAQRKAEERKNRRSATKEERHGGIGTGQKVRDAETRALPDASLSRLSQAAYPHPSPSNRSARGRPAFSRFMTRVSGNTSVPRRPPERVRSGGGITWRGSFAGPK